MTPTLAIVGRPNVGKSTLFNRLTRSRDAIVADVPGLTRDRHYGRGRVGGRPYIVVDTGGLEPELETGVQHHMARQTLQAVDESDGVIFLVDGRAGLTTQDRAIADQLRKSGRSLWLVVNKAEGLSPSVAGNEFHELGLGEPLSISAAHGDGISDLMDEVLAGFPGAPMEVEEEEFPEEEEPEEDEDEAEPVAGPADRRKARDADRHPRIAIVGRPNVGKSTLVNHWLGEERVIAFDQPGTTRDSIEIDFERGGKPYTLIDTAGLRRRGKVIETVEKFSVVKTLQAIEGANVVVLLLDAQAGVTDQDAHIAGYILESGRALTVGINKWDGLSSEVREAAQRNFERILNFLDFAVVQNISARTGQGTDALFASVGQAYAAAMTRLPTPKLTRTLMAAVERQAPPRGGVSRPKMRYAHQGGVNPPRVVIHGNSLNHVPDTYRRYLERFFREAFQLQGTPLRIEFRRGSNPFTGRRKRR